MEISKSKQSVSVSTRIFQDGKDYIVTKILEDGSAYKKELLNYEKSQETLLTEPYKIIGFTINNNN